MFATTLSMEVHGSKPYSMAFSTWKYNIQTQNNILKFA